MQSLKSNLLGGPAAVANGSSATLFPAATPCFLALSTALRSSICTCAYSLSFIFLSKQHLWACDLFSVGDRQREIELDFAPRTEFDLQTQRVTGEQGGRIVEDRLGGSVGSRGRNLERAGRHHSCFHRRRRHLRCFLPCDRDDDELPRRWNRDPVPPP